MCFWSRRREKKNDIEGYSTEGLQLSSRMEEECIEKLVLAIQFEFFKRHDFERGLMSEFLHRYGGCLVVGQCNHMTCFEGEPYYYCERVGGFCICGLHNGKVINGYLRKRLLSFLSVFKQGSKTPKAIWFVDKYRSSLFRRPSQERINQYYKGLEERRRQLLF